MSAPPIEQVFAALGDQQRQALLAVLAHEGDASATALARPLVITRQAVDKHLRVLRDAGLVTSVRTGREVRYRLRSDQLARGAGWLTALAQEWDRQLLSIKVLAEATVESER
jgi:DNA-binding transcriptional ArsR family regulator